MFSVGDRGGLLCKSDMESLIHSQAVAAHASVLGRYASANPYESTFENATAESHVTVSGLYGSGNQCFTCGGWGMVATISEPYTSALRMGSTTHKHDDQILCHAWKHYFQERRVSEERERKAAEEEEKAEVRRSNVITWVTLVFLSIMAVFGAFTQGVGWGVLAVVVMAIGWFLILLEFSTF